MFRKWYCLACILLPRCAVALSMKRGHERRSFLEQLLYATTPTLAFASTNSMPAVASDIVSYAVPTPKINRELSWPLGKVAFSLLPLAGGERRATIMSEIIPGTIYALDQIQGIVNVNVPVRMLIVKLQQSVDDIDGSSSSSLWLHNPIAPTPQALAMVRNLEQQLNATVQHIVLGSVALEHKATFGAFANKFPKATCYVQPGQWSFPLNLPIEFYLGQRLAKRLKLLDDTTSPSWRKEIDYRILGPLRFQSVGAFSETAFYHRPTKSLIVTDLVVSVPREPPAIIAEDPRALLFHARDRATDVVVDTPENRRKGWRRMAQFGLFFFPSQITVSSVSTALQDARSVPPENRNLGTRAIPFIDTLYPWSWADNDADVANFEAVANTKLFCPPILTKLILDREPRRVVNFAETVARDFSDMQRILPSHLDCPIVCTAKDWRAAFRPLESTPERIIPEQPLAEDLALLQAASDSLTKLGVVAPSQVCDGEPARLQGRFRRRYL